MTLEVVGKTVLTDSINPWENPMGEVGWEGNWGVSRREDKNGILFAARACSKCFVGFFVIRLGCTTGRVYLSSKVYIYLCATPVDGNGENAFV